MWRTRGIAMTVALAGHALAMIGIGKVGFSIADAEPGEARPLECALVIEVPAETIAAAPQAPPAEHPQPAHEPRIARTGQPWGSAASAAAIEHITTFRFQIADSVRSAASLAGGERHAVKSNAESLSSQIHSARQWMNETIEKARLVAAQAHAAAAVHAMARERIAPSAHSQATLAASSAGASDSGGMTLASPFPTSNAGTPRGTPASQPSQSTGTDNGVATGPIPAGSNRPPTYPAEALRRRAEGVVVVRAEVNASGIVAAASVLESAGNAELDASALEAVRDWRFEPGRDARGQAIASRADVPVVYRLRSR